MTWSWSPPSPGSARGAAAEASWSPEPVSCWERVSCLSLGWHCLNATSAGPMAALWMNGRWCEEAQLASFTTLFTNICDSDGNIKFGLSWGGAAGEGSHEVNNNWRGEKTDDFFCVEYFPSFVYPFQRLDMTDIWGLLDKVYFIWVPILINVFPIWSGSQMIDEAVDIKVPSWPEVNCSSGSLGFCWHDRLVITVNVPVVYMVWDVMILILMGENPFRWPLEGVGPENRDCFGPWNGNEWSEGHLGPKKSIVGKGEGEAVRYEFITHRAAPPPPPRQHKC